MPTPATHSTTSEAASGARRGADTSAADGALGRTCGNWNTSKKPLPAKSRANLSGEEPGAGEEYHPALEEVQEAVGLLGAPAVHQHADHADAEAVHHDGDRDRREQHDRPLPERRAKEIGSQKAEAQQWIEIS
jgi:hypothetical protein